MNCEVCGTQASKDFMSVSMCSRCFDNELELQKASQANAELRLRITKEFAGYNMTPNEELFAKYYNRGKILVKDMDDTSLREHRASLQEIAVEAKATLLAADDEIRERSAKKRGKDKEWLVSVDTDHSQATADALNNIKTRTQRLSKIDKIRRDLLATGIDEDTVNEMVRNMERKATEQNLKAISFNKPKIEQPVVIVKDNNKAPFDPSKLFKR